MPHSTFQTPRRPLGIRAYNWVERKREQWWSAKKPLVAEELMASAQRRTGLSDFGSDFFREPLTRLLNSYNTEANLNPFGRQLAWGNMRLLLCNRLYVQYWHNAQPDISDKPISRPIVIAGLPRTGTTLLYNLLAQDPANRPLQMWEALMPAPDPLRVGKRDSRIRRSQWVVAGMKRLAPELMTIHPIYANRPEECSRLLMNTFLTAYAALENYVPSYRRWFLERSIDEIAVAYEDYVRQLQVLSWQDETHGRWVLKSPAHGLSVEPLLRVIPGARVVLTHRHPSKVVPSLCSLFSVYRGISSDAIDCEKIGAELSDLCVEAVKRQDQARINYPQNIFDVRYDDVVANPLQTVRKLYDYFDCAWTSEFEERATRWLSQNPKDKHGVHRYTLGQFGLSVESIEEAFQSYCEQHQLNPTAIV